MRFFIVAFILFVLFIGSWRFNRYIDSAAKPKRRVGQTVLWVIAGVGYTCIGVAIILGVLAPVLPSDWTLGLVSLTILLLAFTAAGLPMYLGDVRRDRTK